MYTPRKAESTVLLLSGHVGHLLAKLASDGKRDRIVLWESNVSRPISVMINIKFCGNVKTFGILAEHLKFPQPLKIRKVG